MVDQRSALIHEAVNRRLDDEEILGFADWTDTKSLMGIAAELRDRGHQNTISYSRKDRKSTRLNSSHSQQSRMPSSA